jgi:hypothetical protein
MSVKNMRELVYICESGKKSENLNEARGKEQNKMRIGVLKSTKA